MKNKKAERDSLVEQNVLLTVQLQLTVDDDISSKTINHRPKQPAKYYT